MLNKEKSTQDLVWNYSSIKCSEDLQKTPQTVSCLYFKFSRLYLSQAWQSCLKDGLIIYILYPVSSFAPSQDIPEGSSPTLLAFGASICILEAEMAVSKTAG